MGRAPRVANPFDVGLSLVIKTPHALPMFREDAGRKRGREKVRQVRGGGLSGAGVLRGFAGVCGRGAQSDLIGSPRTCSLGGAASWHCTWQ